MQKVLKMKPHVGLDRVFLFLSILALTNWSGSMALDNGLARTPPMGWSSWERYRCTTDCTLFPNECIDENLYKRTADLMVSEGYKDCGYEYVNLDGCWNEDQNYLRWNETRFPNGIPNLAAYVHSKGLKFGIFSTVGTRSRNLSQGIYGHEEEAANLFASWKCDYCKLTGSGPDPFITQDGVVTFERYLNATGRPIVLSVGWPAVLFNYSIPINYALVARTCNLFRNYYNDITDSYNSLLDIIDTYALEQYYWNRYAGPGHWNNPDQLIIGDFGLSFDQAQAQMAIWAILAAPLIMSVNLQTIDPKFKAILQNKRIIAVDQDRLGIPGSRVFRNQSIDCWTRPIEPKVDGCYSYAIAYLSRRDDGISYDFSTTLESLGLEAKKGYNIYDLYAEGSDADKSYKLKPYQALEAKVNPTGVRMFKAVPLRGGHCKYYTSCSHYE